MKDLRYARRQLARSPGLTAVAVLTLALGAGTNRLLFSVIHAVLLRPLPYPDPDRIVSVSVVPGDKTSAHVLDAQVPHWAYLAWQEESRSFAELAAYSQAGPVVLAGPAAEPIKGALVTPRFFALLGVQPALGRSFTADEQQGSGPAVLLLSYGLWQRRFGGDSGVVGRAMVLDGAPVTIVGVLPASFDFPSGASFWRPFFELPRSGGKTWTTLFVRIVGRLAPGVSMTQARTELTGLLPRAKFVPPFLRDASADIMTLHERLYGSARPLLLVLLGAVGFVLLIACANVASLLVAQAAQREREFAIRAALGAGRARLVRQLLAESLVLSILGAAAGLLVPAVGLRLLMHAAPLLAVDLGVRPDHVLGVYLGRLPNGNDLPGRGSSGAYAVLLERLAALPGVASVALTDALPLGGFASSSTVRVDDAPPVADGGRDAALSAVSPEYFNTLGVQVIAGRAFSSADRVDAAPVAIVNSAFARQFLRGGDPVGHQIAVGGARRTIVGERRTIVGEVKDVLQMAGDVPATPQVFIPASQAGYWPGSVAIRTKLDPTRLVEPVRRTIQEVDPEQPAARVFTLESELAKSAAPQRDSAVLLGAFAAVALALAAVGLAGVMAFLVAHRTHEIGVRVALGAERGDVLRLVVGEGARLVVLGTVIGVIAAGALTRVLRSLLFGVTATDAVTFLVVPLLLAAVALGAAVVPARRATKVDPMVALRYE